MKDLRFLSKIIIIIVIVFGIFLTSVIAESTIDGKKKLDPTLLQKICRNFTIGPRNQNEFFSPNYPNSYISDIACFRIITADIGYFVRIDFRDAFQLEPRSTAGKCEYDFLEIRDGEHGYSPLIGKYCGDQFPPIITSSGRSLWLRFKSDSTIEYKGFKAVYSFIENPLDKIPDIGPCSFTASGYQAFIGSDNITEDRLQHSIDHGLPIDCVWTIQVEEEYRIYIQFNEYELSQPNDCYLNYVQIYDEKTDEENLAKNFCGSVAEAVTSKSNIVYIRFYAENSALDSKFSSQITRVRPLSTNEECDPLLEYDCDDATCIHPDLLCNGIRNCKFGWDEESCQALGSSISMDMSSPHVISILVILSLIILGMLGGMLWNLYRKLSADRQELAAVSRERSLATSSRISINRDPELPTMIPPPARSSNQPPIHG